MSWRPGFRTGAPKREWRMASNEEWYRLKITGDPNPADAVQALIDFVRREFEVAGSPQDFSVYHDVSDATTPVFYFSPEASIDIPGLECFEGTRCPPPQHLEALSRVV